MCVEYVWMCLKAGVCSYCFYLAVKSRRICTFQNAFMSTNCFCVYFQFVLVQLLKRFAVAPSSRALAVCFGLLKASQKEENNA